MVALWAASGLLSGGLRPTIFICPLNRVNFSIAYGKRLPERAIPAVITACKSIPGEADRARRYDERPLSGYRPRMTSDAAVYLLIQQCEDSRVWPVSEGANDGARAVCVSQV